MRIACVIAFILLVFAFTVNAENQTCSGVVCNSPPPINITCSGNSVVTRYYTFAGTCSSGVCSYSSSSTTTSCGTQGTACADGTVDFCERTCAQSGNGTTCSDCLPGCSGHGGIAQTCGLCTSPPSPTCMDGVYRTFASSGICLTGKCTYTSYNSGACNSIATLYVTSSPSGATVSNINTGSYYCASTPCNVTLSPGSINIKVSKSGYYDWTNLVYLYAGQTTTVNAQLYATTPPNPPANDTCSGVTCTSPPSPTCDGNYLKTYNSTGTCSSGTCSYAYTVTSCQHGCSSGQCATNTSNASNCADTDGGKDYSHRGSVTYNLNYPESYRYVITDSCSGSTLNEYYCDDLGRAQTAYYVCPSGCSEGACINKDVCTNGQIRYDTCPDGEKYAYSNCVEGRWVTINYFADPCTNHYDYNSTSYKYAKWTCYDGTSSYKGDGTFCKPASDLKAYAEEFCRGRCDSAGKCGLNSFIVDGSCTPSCGNGICESGESTYCPCTDELCMAPCQLGTCQSDCEAKVCPAVCVPLWEKRDNSCVFNSCGSGCGADGVKTFRTEEACRQKISPCPAGCECIYDDSGKITQKYCKNECNNNGVCDKGEEQNCRDCILTECPLTKKCSDGSAVQCYKSESSCVCRQCPIDVNNLPPNCVQHDDDNGFIRVVCEIKKACPEINREAKTRCAENGGSPYLTRAPNGCEVLQCNFGNERANSLVFSTQAECPSPEDVSAALEKCDKVGLKSAVAFENGCKIGRCVEERPACAEISESEKDEKKRYCESQGLEISVAFNTTGCRYMLCREKDYCEKDPPREAYSRCADDGGQLVVKRDDQGCVSFGECVRRGDASNVHVEKTSVPDPSDLLSVALKLEELKVSLDKLATRASDVAAYYATAGSPEEKRFRRVADMFTAAKGKADEIMAKIRGRADSLTEDDMLEIRRDIKYLRDVVIKDILYVMLSSGDDIEKITSDSKKDCGTDGECFDNALRICQPIKFKPGEDILIEIRGLEDKKCVIYAVSQDGRNDMTCRIEKYSLGIKNPATEVFPYCTGGLVDFFRLNYGESGGLTDINGDGRIDDGDIELVRSAAGRLDVTGDGKLDTSDYTRLREMLNDGDCPDNLSCDLNRDGAVDAADAQVLDETIAKYGSSAVRAIYRPETP